MKRLAVVLAASLLPLLSAAQAAPAPSAPVIWRCGADGRSYSDTPCAEGRSRGTVEIAVARPQADVDDATARARREQRLADRLRAERLKEEADERRANAAAAPQRVKAAASQAGQGRQPRRRVRQRLADRDIFRAVAPASRPARG